ncbi:acrB/AcrD/AcrF family protein, partial [Vibrio parahaemolyticus VPTS-2010_2]
RRYG